MRHSPSLGIALLAILLPAGAATASTAHEPKAGLPHILEFEYSEDYEGIGRHHNAYATLRGEAQRVTARVGDQRAQGKFDDVAGPQSYWNFRDQPFVRALLDDLRADGTATVEVKAVGETRTVRKACELVLEPDDQFGDYAGGDCHRTG